MLQGRSGKYFLYLVYCVQNCLVLCKECEHVLISKVEYLSCVELINLAKSDKSELLRIKLISTERMSG